MLFIPEFCGSQHISSWLRNGQEVALGEHCVHAEDIFVISRSVFSDDDPVHLRAIGGFAKTLHV